MNAGAARNAAVDLLARGGGLGGFAVIAGSITGVAINPEAKPSSLPLFTGAAAATFGVLPAFIGFCNAESLAGPAKAGVRALGIAGSALALGGAAAAAFAFSRADT
jgi:hypothetical protein